MLLNLLNPNLWPSLAPTYRLPTYGHTIIFNNIYILHLLHVLLRSSTLLLLLFNFEASALRPYVLLVLITASHVLHYVLALLGTDSSLITYDLPKDNVDLSSHVRCIAANVEVRLPIHE